MSSSLVFEVKRGEPELIVPVAQTPYEIKTLSDLDDQKGHRYQFSILQFYQQDVGMEGRDPVKVIREAISKALVYYYPFAGRLREGPNHKLMVECTGEGVMFIEADACVRLDQFGDVLQPPFPGSQSLLYDGPGLGCILHCPLLLIQVTRLICGGFTFGLHFNHTMCDGVGLVQFMTAVGELAQGVHNPSVQPVWKRELLAARNPPRISCVHGVYDELQDTFSGSSPYGDMPHRHSCFFFSREDISFVRNHLPPHLQACSTSEILTACLWRCRTVALSPFPSGRKVGIVFAVNARAKFAPSLPVGYYGNAFGLPLALSTASELCKKPLSYALELVKNAKEGVTEEFMRSTTDLLVKKGRPYLSASWYYVSDLTRVGFKDVDFGWGKAVYGGRCGISTNVESFFFPLKNTNGLEGVAIAVSLPKPAMEKFATEIDKLVSEPNHISSTRIMSTL